MVNQQKAMKTERTKCVMDFLDCGSLRPMAILCSILIFIITAIVTTCAILGSTHSKEVVSLLKHDILDEIQDNQYAIDSNEIKLHKSERLVTVTASLMEACMWLSVVNLMSSGLLIYGVVTKRVNFIIPWLVISGMSYTLVVVFEFLAYCNILPDFQHYITTKILIASLSPILVFFYFWRVIFLYWQSLREMCEYNSRPLVVQTPEGYTHTVLPTKEKC